MAERPGTLCVTWPSTGETEYIHPGSPMYSSAQFIAHAYIDGDGNEIPLIIEDDKTVYGQ